MANLISAAQSAIDRSFQHCPLNWGIIRSYLYSVDEFLSSLANHAAAPDEHRVKLVRSIADAFETTGHDLKSAKKKGDAEHLNALQLKLYKKTKLFAARVRGTWRANYSRDPHFTPFDYAVEVIREKYELSDEGDWKSVGQALSLVQIFLAFVPTWSAADEVVGEHLGDLVNSIEDEFKTAELDIENVMKNGDGEDLDAVRANLLQKFAILKPRIREAYDFLSDYAVQTTSPLPPLSDPKVWARFCDRLASNGKFVLHSLWDGALCDEFCYNIVRPVESMGRVSDKHSESDRRHLRGLQGVNIGLARLMFVWGIYGMTRKDFNTIISDLLHRIKPTSPETLDKFMKQRTSLSFFSSNLVGIILPPTKRSLRSLQDGLDPLIEYLLHSYSSQPEDMKMLRSDIEKVVFDTASLSYSYIVAASDNDELLCQLLRRAIILNTELVLMKLIRRSGSTTDIIWEGTFEAIYKGLSSVLASLKNASTVYSQRLTLIFECIEQVARKAESLHLDNEQVIRPSNVKELTLLLDLNLIKIRVFVTEEIMRCSHSFMVDVEDRYHKCNDGVELLCRYLSVLPSNDQCDKELIMNYLKRVANLVPGSQQRFIDEIPDFLSNLLQEVNLMISEIRDNLLQFQRSLVLAFPMIHQGLGFVDVFLEKLRGLKKNQANSVGYSMKHLIEDVLKELDSLRPFLVKVGEIINWVDLEVKAIYGRIIKASYEAEYLIDWILLVKCDWNRMVWVSDVIEEMKALNSKSHAFVFNREKTMKGATQASGQMIIAQTTSPQVEEAVISLEDQEIINRLMDGTPGRRIVTISGMPGIGKTTLAKKVYDNPHVRNKFKIFAWCCVSQGYRRRELLLKLLSDITKLTTDEMSNENDEKLLDKLRQSLKKIEYLVVMDDVWEPQAWHELNSAFPDDQNGSRILFTTRNENLGSQCEHGSALHTLRLLNVPDSWKLLQQKVFGKKECPQELMNVGLKIAEGCKGLPLSIIAIAGVLKTTEKRVDWWKQIEKDLSSRILQSPDVHCMGIFELSFNHLPNPLKPCFLYVAAFGEDSDVSIQKMIQLWIAEGFIGQSPPKSLEDVAENYVENLIARSLLMPAKTGSNGRVKACKVHDMIRQLCLKKVEEDMFLQYVDGYDKLFPSSKKILDYGVDSYYPPISVAYEKHRVSICSKRKHFVMIEPSGFPVRTLLFSAASDRFPGYGYHEIAYTIEKFKILTILDIEGINIGSSFPERIEMLYPLRYLALSGILKSVPSTIAKLWNLETFVVKGLAGNVAVALPDTIRSMSKLRHLHVSTQASFSLKDKSAESSSKLDNMVSLSCPALSHGDNSVEMMKLFPNLQKLKCTFSEPAQHSKEDISFPVLDFLKELESLKIVYYGRYYCQLKGISFPSKLNKLSLSMFSFTWDEFSAIGKIPNLNILKLESITFDTEIWDMDDYDQFQQLKYLKLDSLEIEAWCAEEKHLPRLQQLVLRSCDMLEEVPPRLGYINTLQMIELKRCNASIIESVMDIQKKKIEFSNNSFKAVIDGLDAIPISSD